MLKFLFLQLTQYCTVNFKGKSQLTTKLISPKLISMNRNIQTTTSGEAEQNAKYNTRNVNSKAICLRHEYLLILYVSRTPLGFQLRDV